MVSFKPKKMIRNQSTDPKLNGNQTVLVFPILLRFFAIVYSLVIYFVGQSCMFHVKQYLTSEDIRGKGGLAMILDAMQVKEYGGPGKKQLLKYLWPDVNSPFHEAFKIPKKGIYNTFSSK